MTLETLVTALACLSTTTPTINGPKPVSVIMKNSLEPFRVDNTTDGCPVGTLGGLAARIKFMTDQLHSLKTDLEELQQLIDEYKNQDQTYQLGTRM